MNGVTTIFGHKKWTFLWTVTLLSFYALMAGKLESVHFAGIAGTLGTIISAMRAAEKSKWRKDDD